MFELFLKCAEDFDLCDLYTRVINYVEGVATQENNDSDSERLFGLFLLTVALFCDCTSIQPFTTTDEDQCALP